MPSTLAYILHAPWVTTSKMASCWILFKHPQTLPHFAYMSTKLLPTKTSESHPIWMICSWGHLSSSSITMQACMQHPTNGNKFDCTPLCCIFWNSSRVPSALTCISNAPSDHIWKWYLVEHWFPSILNTPTSGILSTKLLATKTFESHPLSIIWSWTHLP